MIQSLLIANRGEIACRIIRTAQKMNIRTIAVYSDADKNALHVEMADEAIHLGGNAASESYLNIAKIIAAAKASGAQAIHPGYGFLSEKAEFAQSCRDNGVIFVGPSPEAIDAMGLKDRAKALMQKAGVPIVPGYFGDNQEVDFLEKEAAKIGYPVLIKAVAGGGGKGLKRVDTPQEFAPALLSAQREAQAAFGEPKVMIEKYVLNPRHIEIQVFGDTHGNIVHLFERDCSLQRRHQKIIEEAPAPDMPQALREIMGKAAIEAARAVNYVGAGTVEFIADGSQGLHENGFYFMEMNTRLQVEHPVTEAITGVDLVEWQLRVASGEALPLKQPELRIHGHAVEARLYAEDPDRGFLPAIGKLLVFETPQNARVDSGVRQGDEITPFYDPMIAKIITHAPTRLEALEKLHDALAKTVVFGLRTNIAFLKSLTRAKEFREGAFDTGFIEANRETLDIGEKPPSQMLLAQAASMIYGGEGGQGTHFGAGDSFQLGGLRAVNYPLLVDGVAQNITLNAPRQLPFPHYWQGQKLYLSENGRQYVASKPDYTEAQMQTQGGLKAPMHGKVIALFVKPGEVVKKGTPLLVLEAMKMEHTITAPFEGVIGEIFVTQGGQASEGKALLEVQALEGKA
jgi:3-methylcrotonyl-CoA carboxylase alpha subunit